MPQALEVDREQVRIIAMAVGVREAARQCELPESTVQSWSQREGWFAGRKEIEAIQERAVARVRESQGLQPTATSAVDVFSKYGGNTRLKLASVVDKQATCLDTKDPEELVLMAQTVKSVVDSAAKLHEFGNQSVTVNLAVLGDHLSDCPSVE